MSFPSSDTLCEDCGYPLKGLQAEGDCPECGLSIQASAPTIRTGPAWQDRPGAQAGFNVLIAITLNPKHFFRTMRVDGSNRNARLFVSMIAGGIGLGWFIGSQWGYRLDTATAVLHAVIVTASVIGLSYIEAVGVVFFSRKRGWRVPMRLAERIVCYCSLAWVPAAGVMGVMLMLHDRGLIDRAMTGLLGTWQTWQSIGLMVLVGAVAMLWFEVLVWLGVRQTRHANAHPPMGLGQAVVEKKPSGVET